MQLTNRRQRFGEDLAALGSEIERLSRLAYPKCPVAVRDKIACAQFISAITDSFIKRTLQLENVSSLNSAIKRVKTIKLIRGEDFERRGNFSKNFKSGKENAHKAENENGGGGKEERKEKFSKERWQGSKFGAGGKKCWSCGKVGHFRFEYPAEKGNLD